MKLVREHIEFERQGDPKKMMNIGINEKRQTIIKKLKDLINVDEYRYEFLLSVITITDSEIIFIIYNPKERKSFAVEMLQYLKEKIINFEIDQYINMKCNTEIDVDTIFTFTFKKEYRGLFDEEIEITED